MKKIISLLLVTALVLASFAGCGKEEAATPVVTEAVTPEITATEAPEATQEPTPEVTEAAEEDETSLYMSFIEGNLSASFTSGSLAYGAASLVYGPSDNLTLKEIIEQYARYLRDDYLPFRYGFSEYAFIDCGNDSVPELAVRVTFEDTDETMSPYIEYYIFKWMDGSLKCVATFNEYYRSAATLNVNGYYTMGGSCGASCADFTSYFVTGDGENVFLCDDMYYMCLADTFIPSSYIPYGLLPDDYVDEEFDDNGYYLDIYHFDPYADYEYDSEEYNNYLLDAYFVFTDANGQETAISENYKSLYDEIGVKTMSLSEFNDMFTSTLESKGFDRALESADEPEWNDFTLVVEELEALTE